MNLACNGEIAEKIATIDGAIEILVKLLHDSDYKVKACAIGALNNITKKFPENKFEIADIAGAIEDLVKLLSDYDDDIKEYSTEYLMNLLCHEDEDEDQEKIAKIAITQGAIEILVKSLNNSNNTVKEYAAGALMNFSLFDTEKFIYTEGVIESLVKSLNDSNIKIKQYVVSTFNNLVSNREIAEKIPGITLVLESLVKLLCASDNEVKILATSALESFACHCTENRAKITILVNSLNDAEAKAIWHNVISKSTTPTVATQPTAELGLVQVGSVGFFVGNSNIESERPPVTNMELLHDGLQRIRAAMAIADAANASAATANAHAAEANKGVLDLILEIKAQQNTIVPSVAIAPG